jgi:four helix bundle protein
MAFKFENLRVWQRAMDLNEKIFQLSKNLPGDERYNLTSQIKRAADSVVLNIAEGSTSQSNPEFNRFLGYSLRSVVEVVCALFIAKRRNYIDAGQFDELYSFCEELSKMIQSLRKTL